MKKYFWIYGTKWTIAVQRTYEGEISYETLHSKNDHDTGYIFLEKELKKIVPIEQPPSPLKDGYYWATPIFNGPNQKEHICSRIQGKFYFSGDAHGYNEKDIVLGEFISEFH